MTVLTGSDSRQLPDAPLVPAPSDADIAAMPPLQSTPVISRASGREVARVTLLRRATNGPVNVAILGQCYNGDWIRRGKSCFVASCVLGAITNWPMMSPPPAFAR